MLIQEEAVRDACAATAGSAAPPFQPTAEAAEVISFRVGSQTADEGKTVAARGRKRTSAGKRLLFIVAAVGLSTVASCTIAEIALRIMGFGRNYTNPMGSFFVPDGEVGCRGKPSFTGRFHRVDFDAVVAHDENGFRRSEPCSDRPGGGTASPHDVYVLGDSFVWGYGVGQDDVLTNQMARLLHGRVQNCGLIGAGTVQEYLIFQKHVADHLRPGDTVVLVFFGNDFGDNIGLHQRGRLYARLANGAVQLVPPPAPSTVRQWKNKLKDASYLFNLATFCIDSRADADQETKLGDRVTRRIPAAAKIAADTADSSPAVIITRHYLAAIAAACRARQVRFLAVNVPGQAELGEDDVSSTSDLSLPEEIASRKAFERLARELKIETVDLMAPMLAAKRSGRFARLTFAHDFHWNAAGHTVAAEVLAAEIARHSL